MLPVQSQNKRSFRGQVCNPTLRSYILSLRHHWEAIEYNLN